MIRRLSALLLALVLGAAPVADPVAAQPAGEKAAAARILIDKPIRAGDLTLFPDLGDAKSYYYVSDRPRLAVDANGRPQFSFLRWVDNVRSAADQPEAREGDGGGLVHAVVSLAVTTEQVRDAQRELQRKKPGARIVGYVPYSGGEFGLVSSFRDPKTGNLSSQVVGMGKAPLLDGEKAAISILLTKQGAKILWESFETPTPDISFSFEMQLDGYHSPLSAKVEANWDQIYQHEAFAAGFASTFLSAEVNAAFDDLRRDGAIKITQVGDDAAMNTIVNTTHEKLTEMMFSRVESLDPAQLAKAAPAESLMSRAETKLKTERENAQKRNDAIRSRNGEIRGRNEKRAKAKKELEIGEANKGESAAKLQAAEAKAAQLKQAADAARAEANAYKAQWEAARKNAGGPKATPRPIAVPTDVPIPVATPPSETPADKAPPKRKKAGGDDPTPTPKPTATPPAEKKTVAETPPDATPSNPDWTSPCGDVAACHQQYETADKRATGLEQQSKAAQQELDGIKKQAGLDGRDADRERLAAEPMEEEEDEESAPGLAVLATYEMRKVRQSGTFVLDFNKYLTGSITTRFDENIGDLRQLKKDAQHFRQVNLDDPLFKQREIVAMVDGYDATDFGEWINFVTVQLRKKHAGGQETADEVRIDRKNFNSAGNAFKLLYGWQGDQDRRKWLDYEYRTVWSFFGGQAVEQPWKKANAGAISLAPPYQRRKLTLEADPQRIAAAGARSITARVFYGLGGAEQVKQVTLNVDKQQLSAQIEFLLPAGSFEYAYEVTWRLPGSKTVSSGRQASSESLHFVDELPKASAQTSGGGAPR